MTRLTGIVATLATMAAVLSGSAVAADEAPAAPVTAELPREIPGGIEMVLADGDTFRVWTSTNYTTVRGRRRDAATGVWGDPQVILRKKNLYCGDIEGRTSAGAVALTAECDRFGYAEDQAPVSSHALWSADTLSWESYELPGEAYKAPGIAPGGASAVWPLHQGYVVRTPDGFGYSPLKMRGQEYTVTATITDAQKVSVIYGATLDQRCRIVVQTRTGQGPFIRQDLPLADACSDSDLENVDADTAWFGQTGDPARRTTVSRADEASPWAITQIAPADAPGLVGSDSDRLHADFFTAPGVPLLALSSARGHRILAQVYDSVTQTWGPASIAHDAGAARCSWGETAIDPAPAVIAADLRCGARHVVLTTPDGLTWRALPMGKHPLGVSPDGRYVAVPSRSRTSIISAEKGVVTLPGAVTGRCDVVVPDGPDAAVLLMARKRSHGWPTLLRASSASGWKTLARTSLPTFDTPCTRVEPVLYERPHRYTLVGRSRSYTVAILERDDAWLVRRSRY